MDHKDAIDVALNMLKLARTDPSCASVQYQLAEDVLQNAFDYQYPFPAKQLHQAVWPFDADPLCNGIHDAPACGDPDCIHSPVPVVIHPKRKHMTKNPEHVIQQIRFWQEIYIAAIRSGNNIQYAKAAADAALLDFLQKTKMPYPSADQE